MKKLLLLPLLLFASLPAAAQPAKPVVRVATIGHQDHGKSTLTAAISRVLASGDNFASYSEISNASEITVQGVRLNAAQVEYETGAAKYLHVDCRASEDCTKLLSSPKVKLDGVILVVSAQDGPMPQTLEHIRLAHKQGIPAVAVYINKVDVAIDPELLQLVEKEIRELLTLNGYKGDQVPVIRGSALMALKGERQDIGEDSIFILLAAMDAGFARRAEP